MAQISLIGVVIISVALNALAQVFLRAGMKGIGFDLSLKWASQVLHSVSFWAGMGCYAVSIVVWLYVLSRLQVSLAHPFQGVGYILSAVAAWIFLGETVKPVNLLGLVLIVSGLVCLSLGIAKDG